jgi:hypothetical protein
MDQPREQNSENAAEFSFVLTMSSDESQIAMISSVIFSVSEPIVSGNEPWLVKSLGSLGTRYWMARREREISFSECSRMETSLVVSTHTPFP